MQADEKVKTNIYQIRKFSQKEVKQMKKTKKKLKTILANTLLYTVVWGMWTSMLIYGVMTVTTLNQEEKMKIIKENFRAIIAGKCLTEQDILQLFNFGFSKENIVKKYKKDNSLSDKEARKIVENTLLKFILQERR